MTEWLAASSGRWANRGVTAATQTIPPGNGSALLLSPVGGASGTALAVTGGGCPAGATVAISFRGHALGVVKAGPAGEFSATVEIPAHSATGGGPVGAAGPGCHQTAVFTVQAGTTPTSPAAPLPHNVLGLSEVIAGLGIFGIVLLFAIRRNRQAIGRHSRRSIPTARPVVQAPPSTEVG